MHRVWVENPYPWIVDIIMPNQFGTTYEWFDDRGVKVNESNFETNLILT